MFNNEKLFFMRIGKFYPFKSYKQYKISDYIDIVVYDKDGSEMVLQCQIEDVVQNGTQYIYKIFVPHPYSIK